MQSHRYLMRVLLQVLGVYFLIDGGAGVMGNLMWITIQFLEVGSVVRIVLDSTYSMGISVSEAVAGLYLIYSGRFFLDRFAPITRSKCIECGYDLTGNTSGRCPECGGATEPPLAKVAEHARNAQQETTSVSEGGGPLSDGVARPRTSGIIPTIVLGLLVIVLVLGFLRKVLLSAM